MEPFDRHRVGCCLNRSFHGQSCETLRQFRGDLRLRTRRLRVGPAQPTICSIMEILSFMRETAGFGTKRFKARDATIEQPAD
jgi:hypothetical protein